MDRETAWAKADALRNEIVEMISSVWTEDNPKNLSLHYKAMASIFEAEASTIGGALYDEVCSYFRNGATNSSSALQALRRMHMTNPHRVLSALQLLRSTLT